VKKQGFSELNTVLNAWHFFKGGIQYSRLSMWLKERSIRPHLVLEQAVEEGSPHTLDAVMAHRQGQKNVCGLFAWMQDWGEPCVK
jgi:hypothetical protein